MPCDWGYPQYADWSSPIVAVLKADKVFAHVVILSKVKDLFAKLAGGKTFTTLDLSQAYQQLPLNSLLWLIPRRVSFAILCYHSAYRPYWGIFQRIMENLLKGIPGVEVYLNDILDFRRASTSRRTLIRVNAGYLVSLWKWLVQCPLWWGWEMVA